jgi:hypothetical protein
VAALGTAADSGLEVTTASAGTGPVPTTAVAAVMAATTALVRTVILVLIVFS